MVESPLFAEKFMTSVIETGTSELSRAHCETLIRMASEYDPKSLGSREQRGYVRLFYDGSDLTPERLAEIQPAYGRFQRVDAIDPLLYAREDFKLEPPEGMPLMIAFLGPSASGKDSILDLVEGHYPSGYVVNTTTRPLREGSQSDLARYEFVSKEDFRHRREREEFAESLPLGVQGEHFFGTSIESIDRAFASPSHRLSVWRGDLVGLTQLKPWMTKNYPQVAFVTFFVLPQMPLGALCVRIEQKRGLEQAHRWRFPKAVWEIHAAGEMVDVIVLNPPDPTEAPRDAAAATVAAFRAID